MSEDIISELVALDEEARAAVTEAQQQRDAAKARTAKEAKELEEAYSERAHRRIEKMQAEAQRESEAQIAAVGKGFEAACRQLDESYAKNRERWVEEIVNRCRQPGGAR